MGLSYLERFSDAIVAQGRGYVQRYTVRSFHNYSIPIDIREMNKPNLSSIPIVLFTLTALVTVVGVACGGSADKTTETPKEAIRTADKATEELGVRYEIGRYNQHVSEPTPIDYTSLNHRPPTSGHHWPRWAECGFYEEELPDELVVHNMEHGNIVVSYNLVKKDDINSLRKSFSDISLSKSWGVARFYSGIPEGQISLSTWGITDSFTKVDTSRIRNFFEAYHGVLGPEKVPCNNPPK